MQLDALVRGSAPVQVTPTLKLWPVSFGTLMALTKLGNSMVADFMEGRELRVEDLPAMAQFFWAHTRPWEQVHAAVVEATTSGSTAGIDAEVFELAGELEPQTVKKLMQVLGRMQQEAGASQVAVIPQGGSKSDSPKN